MITRADIERASKAIRNVRIIAKRVKKTNLIQGLQIGEGIVNTLNEWRQFCAVNERLPRPSDTYTVFKLTSQQSMLIRHTIGQLEQLFLLLAIKERKPLKDERKQVDLLLTDIQKFIKIHTTGGL